MSSAADKKLYLVHTGFYDRETGFGAYEAHTNFLVVAESSAEAKRLVKEKPIYVARKMHTDSIQEIKAVEGYRVALLPDPGLNGTSDVTNLDYDDVNGAGAL